MIRITLPPPTMPRSFNTVSVIIRGKNLRHALSNCNIGNLNLETPQMLVRAWSSASRIPFSPSQQSSEQHNSTDRYTLTLYTHPLPLRQQPLWPKIILAAANMGDWILFGDANPVRKHPFTIEGDSGISNNQFTLITCFKYLEQIETQLVQHAAPGNFVVKPKKVHYKDAQKTAQELFLIPDAR